MARQPLLSRFRRPPPDGAEQTAGPAAEEAAPARPAPVQRPPTPGALRRERKALVRAREERIRDLGGLMLEMYRRDRFGEELLRDQCAEVVSIEVRIQEVDSMLASVRQQVQTTRCQCGAPLLWGSHFCPNCGRPAGDAVVTCSNCGHALPADARFCGACGAAAPPPAQPGPPPQEPAPPSEEAAAPAAEGEAARPKADSRER